MGIWEREENATRAFYIYGVYLNAGVFYHSLIHGLNSFIFIVIQILHVEKQ